MRESMGGAWLFGIVIVFIFLFAAFLTYSINYTKAFNVKNEIINYIEQYRGYTGYNTLHDSVENISDVNELNKTVHGKLFYLIRSVGYNYEANRTIKCEEGAINQYGVCVVKFCPMPKTEENNIHNTSNTYYKVTTYIDLQIPIIGLRVSIPISGETGSIYTDESNYPCSDEVS